MPLAAQRFTKTPPLRASVAYIATQVPRNGGLDPDGYWELSLAFGSALPGRNYALRLLGCQDGTYDILCRTMAINARY
jgi:hypothetical protein